LLRLFSRVRAGSFRCSSFPAATRRAGLTAGRTGIWAASCFLLPLQGESFSEDAFPAIIRKLQI